MSRIIHVPSLANMAMHPMAPKSTQLPISSQPRSLPLPPSMARQEKGYPDLLSYDEIPEWYQDNEYIRYGYRPVSNSARTSFASWLYIHNESINIYSHLIPAIGFLLGEWYIHQALHSKYRHIQVPDHLILAIFLLAATVCLGLSSTYHTMISHSERMEALWLRLDLTGIVFLILGYFVSGIYMIFWCESLQRIIYWSMVSLYANVELSLQVTVTLTSSLLTTQICTLGALTIFMLLSPWFRGPKWRTFRVLTFVVTGLTGFAPLAHGIQMFGFGQMVKQSGLPYYLGEGGLLVLGAFIYVVSEIHLNLEICGVRLT